jgi:hypothetical protein
MSENKIDPNYLTSKELDKMHKKSKKLNYHV